MRNQGKAVPARQPGTAGGVRSSEGQAGTMPAIVPGSQLLFRVSEAMEILSLGRNEMYKELRSERIRSVGEGRARRITASALLDYIDLLEHEAAKKRRASKKLASTDPPLAIHPTLATSATKEGSQ